jgi:hypothetical protein
LQKFEPSQNEIGEALPIQLNLGPKVYIKTITCLNFMSNGAIINWIHQPTLAMNDLPCGVAIAQVTFNPSFSMKK